MIRPGFSEFSGTSYYTSVRDCGDVEYVSVFLNNKEP